MSTVLILGAGFGGLELAASLSGWMRDEVEVTLIDAADGFLFGFSKLDIAFGGRTREQVSLSYRDLSLPGVAFRRERVTSIDASTRRVGTDGGSYEADYLVVALGADYDLAATPGFAEDGCNYYSPEGAELLRDALPEFRGGRILVSVLGVPFKCPPAPFEGAFLLHSYLSERGLRNRTTLSLITPMDSPIPVSKETSAAIVGGLRERGIECTFGHRVRRLDPDRHVAVLKDGEVPYDLFIGVPVHKVPEVVAASGLTAGGRDGWIKVDPRTLATPFPGVYAIGDCADAPVPRAGVFAESAARTVADQIRVAVRGGGEARAYDGRGSCYIEFGGGLVGKVEADFLSGPTPRAPFVGPSRELAEEKQRFAEHRRRRWFGADLARRGNEEEA